MSLTRWVLMVLMSMLVTGCEKPLWQPTVLPLESRTSLSPVVRVALTTIALLRPASTASITTAPAATVLSQRTLTACIATPPARIPTVTPTWTRAAPTATPAAVSGRLSLTILYDNNAYDERLETAWGFSCLVEGLEKTILFEAGGDGALFLRNMQILGVDPGTVDVVVISHVHSDHVGGLPGFLRESSTVTVYLLQSFPENVKNATREAGAELVEVHRPVEICERAAFTGELGAGIKEQALVIGTARGRVVITGCAHPGIVNVVHHAKEMAGEQIHLVLGGFHLGGASRGAIAGIVEDPAVGRAEGGPLPLLGRRRTPVICGNLWQRSHPGWRWQPAGCRSLKRRRSPNHFKDATSCKETYGGGRYMDLDAARHRTADGKWILDLNRAYNPWCVFSEAYTCPFVPHGNWLAVPVRTCEKDYPKE